MKNNDRIAIIGLGYVGLPLAVEFGKKYRTIGYDINKDRVDQLNSCNDLTLETSSSALKRVINKSLTKKGNVNKGFYPTNEQKDLFDSNIYIITVPTPINKNKKPNLKPLKKASELVGKYLNIGDIVIYESTVYPGATEEFCIPVLEKVSKLKFNKEFYAGYSPERINPGDKNRTLTKILKITSGSTENISKKIDKLYNSIIQAGTYLAPSIKVAEAAKVIENSQRDINIAFVNELAKIFNKLKIDTNDVLDAASTKWNFLPFKPGLVGGHCIGVDPYYLADKALEVGYNPEIILSGRKINDSMSKFIALDIIKLMTAKNININNAKLLVLGITFKENCPDTRNTKVIDLINELLEFKTNIKVYDPWVDINNFRENFSISITNEFPVKQKFDGVILAVPHKIFLNINLKKLLKRKSIVYDIKGFYDRDLVDQRL